MDKYSDRSAAGKILANELQGYANRQDVIVLALPRGGVPVAYEVAKSLSAPLDVFIVRKLGVPGHVELALGAIASGDTIFFNEEIIRDLHISENEINHVIAAERQELSRRAKAYRGDKPFPNLTGKTIILVDDGIATGATMRAAIAALRKLNPARIIVAVPVADYELSENLAKLVDKLVCPKREKNFCAVGLWYIDFSQTEDEEVFDLLNKSKKFAYAEK